ncbi:hypothetical protein FPOAC2_11180 [Fusarium poae]
MLITLRGWKGQPGDSTESRGQHERGEGFEHILCIFGCLKEAQWHTCLSNSSIMARRPGRWLSAVPVNYFTPTYHEKDLAMHGMILNNGNNVKSKLCFIINAVFTLISLADS